MAGAAKTVYNRLVCVCLGELDFCIDMAAVTDCIQTVFYHAAVIGSVRIVAAAARAFGKRLVRNRHFCCRTNILMTGETNVLLFADQQSGMLRRMVLMARQACFFLVDGLVGRFYLCLHLTVAPKTQGRAGLGKQFRIF
jgi:hypothetical protein